MEVITNTSNARVKQLIQYQKKAKERNRQDVFVVEGPKMFGETPRERLVQVFVSESFYQKNEADFGGGSRVTVLSDRVFESVSDTRTPQGVLALVRQYHYGLKDLLGRDRADAGTFLPPAGQVGARTSFLPPAGQVGARTSFLPPAGQGSASVASGNAAAFIVALENLQDPGNLGTILRTAEGAGATGVLLSSGCVDIYNPKVVRSTMGAIFRVPFYYTDDLRRDLLALRGKGMQWYAAHLEGSVDYDEAAYCGPVGILIGNESQGLTEEMAALADQRIRIPMCGQAESLNAAVAASVLMYEANRQRRTMRQ